MPQHLLGTPLRKQLPPERHTHLQNAMVGVVTHYPGFLHALLEDAVIEWDEHIPTACLTHKGNGQYAIKLNHEFFATLNVRETVFVLCHEGLHRAFQHLDVLRHAKKHGVPVPASLGGGHLPFDAERLAIAMDLIINTFLMQERIGEMPQLGINPSQFPPVDLQTDTVYTVYARLGTPSPSPQPMPHPMPHPMDDLEAGDPSDEGPSDGPSSDPDPEPSLAQIEKRAAQALQTVAEHQKQTTAGKGVGGLTQMVEHCFEALVDWREQLADCILRHNTKGAEPTWSRPARRMLAYDVVWPSGISFSPGVLVIAHDTSGSVSHEEAAQFLGETASILAQCQPEKIILLPVDAEVHTPVFITPDGDTTFEGAAEKLLNAIKDDYRGGGGTSFNPPFEWVTEHCSEPVSQLVYLTDGYGSVKKSLEPAYPVLWVTTGDDEFPFGDVVTITPPTM